MVDITKVSGDVEDPTPEPRFDEKLKAAYSTAEEELIDFLNRCRLKNIEVMLCLRCSVVFDKEATKGLEGFIPKPKKREKWYGDHRPKFSFNKSYISFINNSSTTTYVNKSGQGKAFVPYAPDQKWVQLTHKNVQHGKNNVVKGSASLLITKMVLLWSQRSMLTTTTINGRTPLQGLNGEGTRGPKKALLQALKTKSSTQNLVRKV